MTWKAQVCWLGGWRSHMMCHRGKWPAFPHMSPRPVMYTEDGVSILLTLRNPVINDQMNRCIKNQKWFIWDGKSICRHDNEFGTWARLIPEEILEGKLNRTLLTGQGWTSRLGIRSLDFMFTLKDSGVLA